MKILYSIHEMPLSVRGILWMVLGSFFYAMIYVVVRGLSDTFEVSQIVFFRAVLGAFFMIPWLLSAGLAALRTAKISLYLWRMIFSYLGALAWMYGISGMPLAEANALMFTLPLFTILMAAFWLSENIGFHRIAATVVGFIGALIILRPGIIEVSAAALSTLGAAALFSAALIGTKKLAATENANAMVFYLYSLMIPFAAIGALHGWVAPAIADIPLLLALGICTVGAQQSQTRAFKVAPASLVVIINYIQLPFIALLAWLFFRQSTDIWTWIGAAVICISTYFLAKLERSSEKPKC